MPPLVLVTETLDKAAADWLAQRVELRWCPHDRVEELRRLLPGAEGLVVRTYTQVNEALLAQAPKLKVVARGGVGLENIDLDACRKRGVRVVYTPDANTQAVVEYVIALILDAIRPRPDMDLPRFHRQREQALGTQLSDLTLGILGFGRIGKRLGKAACGLAVPRILVNDLIPEKDLRPLVDYNFQYVDKPTLYRESDILSIHVDGRRENRRLIDASVLALLRPTCLFINAARGMLVDHAALASWARAHPQAKVILDVHDPEPPGSEYPVLNLPNVRLLPHLASRTHTAMANMSWVVRDLVAVLQGQPPRYPAWTAPHD